MLEQQKDYLLQIESLNEQITFQKSKGPILKVDSPVHLNESIIIELKTELKDKKVFNIIYIYTKKTNFYNNIFNQYKYI